MARLRIPDDVAATLRTFYTCEVTTVNRQGQPITWPALTVFDEPNGRLILSVSIAFPVKAQNARRHPQVSLLYSDPTGSQLTDPVAALVQGDAVVTEGIDPLSDEMRALAAAAAKRQPDSGQFSANPIARRLFTWYLFQRLLITVTPRRLLVWPHRDFSHAPIVITLDSSSAADMPTDAAEAVALTTAPATTPAPSASAEATASASQHEEAPDVE